MEFQFKGRWSDMAIRDYCYINFNIVMPRDGCLSAFLNWLFKLLSTSGHLLAESFSGLIRESSCPETSRQSASGRRRRSKRNILTILRRGAEYGYVENMINIFILAASSIIHGSLYSDLNVFRYLGLSGIKILPPFIY